MSHEEEEESMQPYLATLSLCCHLVPFIGITTKKKALLSLTQTEAVSLGYDRFLDSVGKLKTTTKNNGKKLNLLNVSSAVRSSYFTNRHSTKLELHSHLVLGPEPLWHFLHPGCTRALLHWRFHSVLHHYQTFPVLPHSGQHPGLPAESTSAHLVPHVLFLWVQCQRTRPQRVLLALF